LFFGSISGFVLGDINNSDTGDVPIGGVNLFLFDSAGKIVSFKLTDSNGFYEFNGLPTGTYTVVETDLPGFISVSDTSGSNDNIIQVVLGAGAGNNSTGNNFTDEVARTISGVVLEDTINNNVGDKPIGGVIIELHFPNGTFIASTTTDSNGAFNFEGIFPGVYTVVEKTPVGFVDVGDSDGGDPNVLTIDVTSGNKTSDNYFTDKLVSASPTSSESSPPFWILPRNPSAFPSKSISPSGNPSIAPTTKMPVGNPDPWPRRQRFIKETDEHHGDPMKTNHPSKKIIIIMETECERNSKALDILPVSVDSCSVTDFESPIKIISQDGASVTFSVRQVWKGCTGGNDKLAWMAADYIGLDNELHCSNYNNLICDVISEITAKCSDGVTVVDLFGFEPGLFSQTDGSGMNIPEACQALGNIKEMCHFRYILKCTPSLCTSIPSNIAPRRLGGA